jgi:hypothetical protein
MLRRMVLIGVAAAVAGCATSYGSSGIGGGYDIVQLQEDIYRVTVSGNGFTTRETVSTYWYHRAAEFTLDKGYTGFQMLSRTILSGETTLFESDIRLVSGDNPHTPPVYFDARLVKERTEPYVKGDKRCDAMGNVCPHVRSYLEPAAPAVQPKPRVAKPADVKI